MNYADGAYRQGRRSFCMHASDFSSSRLPSHFSVFVLYGKGWQARNEAIDPDQSVQHQITTTLNVDALCQTLRQKGYAVVPSIRPGRFICNYIYYNSLKQANDSSQTHMHHTPISNNVTCACSCHALFVHVPPFTIFPLETQLNFIQDLVDELIKMTSSPNSRPIRTINEKGDDNNTLKAGPTACATCYIIMRSFWSYCKSFFAS